MKRHLIHATAASLAFAIGSAHAGSIASEEQLMDACIQQFIADNLAGYQGKVTVSKSAVGYHPLSLGSRTEIVVSAVHKTKGESLGAVVCKLNRDGTVSASPDAVTSAKIAKLAKASVIARSAD